MVGNGRKKIGALGEQIAANYLNNKGYMLVEANFRTSHGEIDLVVKKGRALHCVEVKSRGPTGIDPLEQLTNRKRQQMIYMARAYLSSRDTAGCEPHLSVVTVDLSVEPPLITWYPDAVDV